MKFLRQILVFFVLSVSYVNSLQLHKVLALNYATDPFLLAHGSSGIEEVLVNITLEQVIESENEKLKDLPSILDHAFYGEKSTNLTLPPDYYLSKSLLCSEDVEANTAIRDKVFESIWRTLKFIDTHNDQMFIGEIPFVLSWIQGIDFKHGGRLQKAFPIQNWISEMCAKEENSRVKKFLFAVTDLWKPRRGPWMPASLIQDYSTEFHSVGNESEVIWGRLNGECQMALVTRCEVPYLCKSTFYDPSPKSQYMLTHQLLMRIWTELGTCSSARELIDYEVNHKLCAKIYNEAKLIHALNTPERLRDLFSEQVGLCGYAGYPNFFRQDWLETILSWQSKSDYGCFVTGPEAGVKFISTDRPIKRMETLKEQKAGIHSNEQCLPHFTSVSLMALSSYWDYLEENCL